MRDGYSVLSHSRSSLRLPRAGIRHFVGEKEILLERNLVQTSLHVSTESILEYFYLGEGDMSALSALGEEMLLFCFIVLHTWPLTYYLLPNLVQDRGPSARFTSKLIYPIQKHGTMGKEERQSTELQCTHGTAMSILKTMTQKKKFRRILVTTCQNSALCWQFLTLRKRRMSFMNNQSVLFQFIDSFYTRIRN
ncbi:hypothetical protein AA313_de0203057 [Arthrobotrys entomopaga]|nr:hypothetical protein AA313_de0203057 [Arthrobotrys entomopaga]